MNYRLEFTGALQRNAQILQTLTENDWDIRTKKERMRNIDSEREEERERE